MQLMLLLSGLFMLVGSLLHLTCPILLIFIIDYVENKDSVAMTGGNVTLPKVRSVTYLTLYTVSQKLIHKLTSAYLDAEYVNTLIHVFVLSCVHGCNAVLSGSTKATSDRLQRVLNAAVRVVSGTHKYDRGFTHLLHSELHWLDVLLSSE